MCQCPLGLELLRGYSSQHVVSDGFNALSGLSCYDMVRKLNAAISKVSMPSRAYTSFLRYPFKNLGFMRFPEPVFAGICQNILTVAHFHACLQFGHIL